MGTATDTYGDVIPALTHEAADRVGDNALGLRGHQRHDRHGRGSPRRSGRSL
jgi:hypothetical protein